MVRTSNCIVATTVILCISHSVIKYIPSYLCCTCNFLLQYAWACRNRICVTDIGIKRFIVCTMGYCWSLWLRGPRCRSATTCLLGFRVRIPPGTWISVSCDCCRVKVFASGLSLVQRIPTKCVMSECELEASLMKRLSSSRVCCTIKNHKIFLFVWTSYLFSGIIISYNVTS